MPKIIITASNGEKLTARLPTGWHEVPLGPYATLAAARTALPSSLPADAPQAWGNPGALRALAALLSLPAEPFLAEPALLLAVYQATPWLFNGPLPEVPAEPLPSFTHLGATYTYAGGLERATAGQLEALLTFLKTHEGHPLGCGPHLLAILYQVPGQAQTPETVQAAYQALASLPVSIAWPALRSFTLRSAPWALSTQRFFATQAATGQALSALEQALTSPTSGPRAYSWNIAHWLGRVWIRRARKVLTMCSPPFATTGRSTPPSSRVINEV